MRRWRTVSFYFGWCPFYVIRNSLTKVADLRGESLIKTRPVQGIAKDSKFNFVPSEIMQFMMVHLAIWELSIQNSTPDHSKQVWLTHVRPFPFLHIQVLQSFHLVE